MSRMTRDGRAQLERYTRGLECEYTHPHPGGQRLGVQLAEVL